MALGGHQQNQFFHRRLLLVELLGESPQIPHLVIAGLHALLGPFGFVLIKFQAGPCGRKIGLMLPQLRNRLQGLAADLLHGAGLLKSTKGMLPAFLARHQRDINLEAGRGAGGKKIVRGLEAVSIGRGPRKQGRPL
jgi:hypothetical protein